MSAVPNMYGKLLMDPTLYESHNLSAWLIAMLPTKIAAWLMFLVRVLWILSASPQGGCKRDDSSFKTMVAGH